MSEISKAEGLSHLAAPVLATLRNLVRDHLLHFRLEVGRVILDTFFNGSAAAYGDKNPNKESTFNDFLAQNAAELDELGLKPWLLRQCVQVQIVYRTLPSTVRDDLGFSRTLALVKVGDPTMRARLANDALAKRLTLNQFQDVVDSAIAGTWYDTDPATPGVQPRAAVDTPAPVPPEPPPQPGRMVKRAEMWVSDAADFAKGWATIDTAKVKPLQRARLKTAIGALRAELAAFEAKLGE